MNKYEQEVLTNVKTLNWFYILLSPYLFTPHSVSLCPKPLSPKRLKHRSSKNDTQEGKRHLGEPCPKSACTRGEMCSRAGGCGTQGCSSAHTHQIYQLHSWITGGEQSIQWRAAVHRGSPGSRASVCSRAESKCQPLRILRIMSVTAIMYFKNKWDVYLLCPLANWC